MREKIRTLRLSTRLLTSLFTVVIIAFTILTLVLAQITGSLLEQKDLNEFNQNATTITSQVKSALFSYQTAMYGGRAFILGSQEVTNLEWNTFWRSQDVFNRYPGLSSISYIQVVKRSELNAFLQKKRAVSEFGPNFNVDPPGDREEYALGSVTISKNPVTPTGFDVYSTSDRRNVYKMAEISGEPAASPQIKLPTGYDGMFIVLPVFRSNTLVGYVLATVRTDDFLKALFSYVQTSRYKIEASDITDNANAHPIFSINPEIVQRTEELFTHSDTITLAGRQWKFAYSVPKNYSRSVVASLTPSLILGVGLLIITIVALAFRTFLSSTLTGEPKS
jgi:CHASE1-domain containing sensor protein